MQTYTSKEILELDIDDMPEVPLTYEMTEGELQWLDFITGRYCIHDYIMDNLTEGSKLTIYDIIELSIVLDNDCNGFGKAVMLSDDTALQLILFCNYIEESGRGRNDN